MTLQNKYGGTLERIYSDQDLIVALRDYLDVALINKFQRQNETKKQDKTFTSNEEFWKSAIADNLIVGQIVNLDKFKLLEWIPASPGLYFTDYAERQRYEALESYHRWNRKDDTGFSRFFKPQNKLDVIELRPNEKMGMVQGGYGCLRVAPKNTQWGLQYILCASSSGIGHEGIAIVLNQVHYEKVISQLKEGKVPIAKIVGRIMVLSKELSLIKLEYYREVPKFYLQVEELEISSVESSDNALVSVAITYTIKEEFFNGSSFSYSFCSFSPTKKNKDLKEAVNWLQEYAQRYSNDKNPIIVGDFDEEFVHFQNVEFPIQQIANGNIPLDKLLHFKELFHFKINEYYMGDKNVITNSNVGFIGSNNTVSGNTFNQANYSVPENLDYEQLQIELTKLKEELQKSANTPEDFSSLSQVASAEAASKEKDGNTVVKHLKSAGKWVLDTATKIGVNLVTDLIKKQM